jgi:hypothetical protein
MRLIPVTSSAISEIGWHNEVGLVVRFQGGHIWCYDDHDHALFDGIMAAPSKGQAFDRLVKKSHVNGVQIAELELSALLDSDPSSTLWKSKNSNPVMFLRELLKTNRASAYF